ncbi:hypothetical protein D3C72_1745110 [compost metagenome]
MQGIFSPVEQAGLQEVQRQRMLRTLAVGAAEVAAGQQVFVHAHGAVVFAPATEQIAQRKVQLRGVGVVLYRLYEGINGLVLLLVEQEVQPFEVGLGCTAVLGTQLAQVKPRRQPAENKGDWQAQQDPAQVKFHGRRAGREVEEGRAWRWKLWR